MKSRRLWLAAIVALLGGGFACLSGPLFPFKPRPSDIAQRVADAPDLDAYLRARESGHAIKPGLAKSISWANPAHEKTPLALVHLHGFSASRKDISPVVETLAGKLAANVFFTRLAAHALTTPAELASVTAQDWLDDAREALAIGRRIGDRVVLIGISTGALLATMAALENQPDVAALVLLSPNFGIRDFRAKFASGPLGAWIAQILIGSEYRFRPHSIGHAEFWTTRFPSRAIVAVMDLVNGVRLLRFDRLTIPTLVIYTHKDVVVDPAAIRARFEEMRGRPKRIVDLPGATRHELTGDALAPETVPQVVDQILQFVSAVGGSHASTSK
jgi:alpha-beta hydrolase superfamily lysophospholipase